MKRRDEQLDRILDEALGQIRESALDPRLEREASERVWQRLPPADSASDPSEKLTEIRSCADFQALIDPYLQGGLGAAREILVRDHFGECVPCHRALKDRRAARKRTPAAGAPAARSGHWTATLGWRAAAAAVIFLAVVGFSFKTDVLSFESGGLIRVELVEGEVFHLTEEGAVPLSEGETVNVEKGESIRTAKDSTAVLRLSDDSQVEMRARSELAVLEKNFLVPGRRDDGVIDLERGSIIVEASDQGSGHLYVDTQDCKVAVTGTVFSVNRGNKGSRVSVIEGEVHVDYGNNRDVLTPGQQTTTSISVRTIPVEDEISWSRNREQYVAVLREMRALSREIEQALRPDLRYSTDLLDLAPAMTAVYVAMPNVSNGLGEAWQMLQSRVASNPILQQWWDSQVTQDDAEIIGQVFDKIRAYGDHLGEEILLTVPMTDGEMEQPLFLARITGAQAFLDMLEQDIAEVMQDETHGPVLTRIEGSLPAAGPEGGRQMLFWVEDDLLAVSPSFQILRTLDGVKKRQLVSLSGSTFHDSLAKRYAKGVEWLVGVDLETIIRAEAVADPTFEELGFADIQHVIAERRQQGDRTENRADLTFAQPRRRMAAWLAEPSPLGSLDYISPDASFLAAFAMKDLGTLVDELFEIVGANEEGFWDELGRFESENGIDVRRDIAAPLGGEFALALDGPVLPKPSWKLVMEVYDPAKLQQVIGWFVDQVNREVDRQGTQTLTLDRERAGGRDYLRIVSVDTGLEVHLVFHEGYLIAGPSRALLDRSLQTRATRINLADSPAFRELLPQDRQVNFSGVIYQNLGSVLGSLSETFGSLSEMGAEDLGWIQSLGADATPSLVLIYGEQDRISVTSTSEGGLLSSGLNSLTGFGSLLGMQESLIRNLTEEARSQEDARSQ